jgi:hypothetical protein
MQRLTSNFTEIYYMGAHASLVYLAFQQNALLKIFIIKFRSIIEWSVFKLLSAYIKFNSFLAFWVTLNLVPSLVYQFLIQVSSKP